MTRCISPQTPEACIVTARVAAHPEHVSEIYRETQVCWNTVSETSFELNLDITWSFLSMASLMTVVHRAAASSVSAASRSVGAPFFFIAKPCNLSSGVCSTSYFISITAPTGCESCGTESHPREPFVERTTVRKQSSSRWEWSRERTAVEWVFLPIRCGRTTFRLTSDGRANYRSFSSDCNYLGTMWIVWLVWYVYCPKLREMMFDLKQFLGFLENQGSTVLSALVCF